MGRRDEGEGLGRDRGGGGGIERHTCCSLNILLQFGRPAYFMLVVPPCCALTIISCKLSSPVINVLRDIFFFSKKKKKIILI